MLMKAIRVSIVYLNLTNIIKLGPLWLILLSFESSLVLLIAQLSIIGNKSTINLLKISTSVTNAVL